MVTTAIPPSLVDPQDTAPVSGAALRVQPHNVEAEKALLGAIFANRRAYEKVVDFLRPEHFAVAEHGRIFEACMVLIERAQIADPVTLKIFFEAEQSLAEIGGPAYLAELALSAVTIINAGEYGRIVYDLYLRRQLIELGEDVVNDAYAGDIEETAPEQIEKAEQRLYDLAASGKYEGGFEDFRTSLIRAVELAQVAHQRDGKLSGVLTGLRDLDKKLGGQHASDLLVLAGRPSMGKTALATNIAYNAARAYKDTDGAEGAVVGFFSLEMSAEQLATRILSEQIEVSSDRIRKGDLSNDDFARFAQVSQTMYDLPIFIDDSPALSASQLRTRARRLKSVHGLGLIVVDYLQLMSLGPGVRRDNRVQEVSEITRGLKTLAKELDVPVLALSQLSRAVEQREDKHPQLSDLRESGSIEQDSDVVMFIYREQYYLERAEPQHRADESMERYAERHVAWVQRCEEAHNKSEVIIAKQRHGPVGKVHLLFEGEFTRFRDLETRLDEDHRY
jgi:replicative DNA helicase